MEGGLGTSTTCAASIVSGMSLIAIVKCFLVVYFSTQRVEAENWVAIYRTGRFAEELRTGLGPELVLLV
jgi:hypothetical protein